MNILELLNLAQNKSGVNVSQSMLAKALGVTRQTINNRIRNNSEITISELMKFQDYLEIKIFNNESDVVLADYYPDVFASCGNGVLFFSEEKETIELNRKFFKNIYPSRKYSVICAKGDSMYPYINDGDRLLVEHWGNDRIKDNKVYVFCYRSEVFVKRLSKNLDEIVIKSDNPDYGTRVVSGEDINDLDIIGQIVGVVRNI
ncbi:MAG: helix-turn-helix domain-containing protein [Cyanobacteria bacterium RUI128]|nr:helix-turn-helix domain-containing protein [Cyanobacteria bacterium RUI128]